MKHTSFQSNPKKVLIWGLGVSGKSVLSYFQKKNIACIGIDKKAVDVGIPVYSESEALQKNIVQDVDLLVKSPGVPPTHPLFSEAKKHQIEVTSEIELALNELKKEKKSLFAITGSNGKTTTSLLTTHILNNLGVKALCLGNVGKPLLSYIEDTASVFIIELSSYQIEEIHVKALDAGVILNITPNHLDRYDSFESYARAKLHLQRLLKPSAPFFVHEQVAEKWKIEDYHLFPSLHPAEKIASIFSLRYRDGRWSHNYDNFRAAFALCGLCGIEEKSFWQGAENFVKPPHRLEFIGAWKNVRYVNDSKATSVDAVIKAIDSIPEQVILIAGGVDKGGAYMEWVPAFKNKVRKILLIGEAEEKIAAEIGVFFDIEKLTTLEMAVSRAAALAHSGETVLFSPGCSSFDQFQNFEHRGEIFKQLVFALGEKSI